MNETLDTLLAPDDPPAFTVGNESGASPFLLVADHAGKALPRSLGTLGLGAVDLDRHIAWDIGAGALAQKLGAALDAFVIRQTYSRLAIDCNRKPSADSSIVSVSELTPVPSNARLSAQQRLIRRREIFDPYHERIALELDRRTYARRPTVFISVHSFTPVFKSVARQWHAGVLYNRRPRFPHALLQRLRSEPGLLVGDNEPYSMSDESDYTVPVHAEARALHYVELEIRQDLVTDAAGQERWAALLARVLPQAYRDVSDGMLPTQDRDR